MTTLRRNPRTLWRRISDDQVIVFPPGLSEPTTLSGAAARLWLDLDDDARLDPAGSDRAADASLDLTIAALVLSGALEELG